MHKGMASTFLVCFLYVYAYKIEGVLPIWIKEVFKSLQKANTGQ